MRGSQGGEILCLNQDMKLIFYHNEIGSKSTSWYGKVDRKR